MKRPYWLALLAVIILIAAVWIIYVPGPLAFAKGGSVALADYKDGNPTGVPAKLAKDDLVSRGKYLTRAADCEACHTAKGGEPYAGGLAFNLPFGTLYSPNITPDKETGIGNWTDADFLNAVHKGIAPDGSRLYPAFPYTSYTMLTDDDVLAIKAYLFSLAPVRREAPPNTLAFPFNQRWGMVFWSLLYNSDERFRPDPKQSAEWNRGAYLAEALGHCGECHTPRNLMQALNNRKKFGGAVTAGWKAYNITQDKETGIGSWDDETTAKFLAHGHVEGFGTASGPMGEAIDMSLMHLEPDDIKALVTYLKTIPPISDPELPVPKTTLASAFPKAHEISENERGAMIFAGACAACHGWSGESPVRSYANFVGGRTINDPSARNVAQAVIWGVTRHSPEGEVTMPAFGKAYSPEEIAAVVNYVTARFGAGKSHITAQDVVKIGQQASQ
ncbi:cytochrome c [Hyphomicrobium sp.]|uniref:cytochrome c n=1 Tax=Hyphomicrobium sp. TaxID=82 RepID=UPI001DA85CFD|nr:cytochrome c [Hyphomicrobium sp.]MBY0561280.1 cytochrome c [Hyphomicrobium sp.]